MPTPSVPLDAIRQPAFLYGADARIVAVNGPAEALAGRRLEGLRPEDVAAVLAVRRRDGAALAEAEQPVARALAGEASVDVPLSLTAADGSTIHVIGTVSPVTEDGRVRGALAIWQNVTALEEAEAALRDRDAAFRTIFETANEGIWEMDERFVTLRVNPTMADMLGYRPEEMVGRPVPEFLFPEDIPEHVPRQEDRSHGLRGRYECRLRHRDGSERWALVSATPKMDATGTHAGSFAMFVDITDRKRMEATLSEHGREARERLAELEAVYDMAPVGFAVLDRDLRYVRVNRILAALNGLPVEAHIGRTVRELAPVVADQVEGPARQVLETGEPIRGIAIVAGGPGDEGRDRDMLVHWAPVRDGAGGITGVMVAIVEVTELKRTEEALRTREQQLNLALEGAGAGMWVRDSDGRWVGTSQLTALFGLPPDTPPLREEDFPAFIHPDDLPTVGAAWFAAQEGSSVYDQEYRVVWPDGSVHWLASKGRRVTDAGGASRFIGITFDITARKQAEEELRVSLERLAFGQRAARIGFWDWDMVTERLDWSPEFYELFGLDPAAGASFETWLAAMHPEDQASAMTTITRSIDEKKPLENQYRIILPDGTTRWIEALGDTTYGADGRPLRMAGICFEITERMRHEEALREYSENLARSNEDLERFAYVSSHDLQEPLRAIVSFSQLLERRYKGQLDADADEYIAFIVEGGQRMQSLILDLLAYSRVNTTQQALTPTATDDVLAAVERNLALQLNEAGATLAYGPMPTVLADPLQLEQVFTNLVSNAIKFRRDGVPLHVQIGARRIGGFWELWVADNGIGIENEYLDQIFVIFQRLHTKDAYPGTGIGLAIVKRIIDRHGGQIGVESVPGEGTTFFFTLPAADIAARHGSG